MEINFMSTKLENRNMTKLRTKKEVFLAERFLLLTSSRNVFTFFPFYANNSRKRTALEAGSFSNTVEGVRFESYIKKDIESDWEQQ